MDERSLLAFLKEKRNGDPAYARAIEALEQAVSGGAAAPPGDAAGDVDMAGAEAMVPGALRAPQGEVDEFDRLCLWVDRSLDAYRYELSRVLYPIMVKLYVRLVGEGRIGDAARLLGRHRDRFAEAAGNACVRRIQEMKELAGMTERKHAGSEFARKIVETPFTVSLSEFPHRLLFSFLEGARLGAVLDVVNGGLSVVEEFSRPPLKMVDDDNFDAPVGDVGAELAQQAQSTNGQPVSLGRAPNCWEDRLDVVQQKAMKAYEERVKEHAEALKKAANSDVKPDPPKKPHEAPVILGERAEVGEEIAALINSAGTGWEEQVLRGIAHRARVAHDALPSCCFFTFVNTSHSLACAAVSPDARWLAGGFEDSTVRVFNLAQRADKALAQDATQAQRKAGLAESAGHAGTAMRGHTGPVFGVDLSPDGELAVSASADGTAALWSTELKCLAVRYESHTHPVWDAKFSPFGYYFATGSADTTAMLWTTDRKFPVRVFAGHQSDVDCVSWLPSAHLVATGSSDTSVRLWDVGSAGCVRVLAGVREPVTSLACSPDGLSVAAGCADGSIKVWDIRHSALLASLKGHRGAVWALGYAEGQGSVLASGGADSTVRLWHNPQAGDVPALADRDAGGKRDASKFLLRTWHTKSTHVYSLRFTWSNLLLGSGALTLPQRLV